MGLGPGAEEPGRYPGDGRSGDFDAVPVQGSPAGEGDGVGFNQDGGRISPSGSEDSTPRLMRCITHKS